MKRPFSIPETHLRPWKLGPPERRGHFRVFSVFAMDVQTPDGETRPEIYTIGVADSCSVVAVTEDEQLVLVRQLRFGTRELSLELPGGMLAQGEDPARGVLRELREETGYEALAAEPLIALHTNPSLQRNRHFAFVASGARLVGAPIFDEHEDCEVVLVPVEHAERLLDEGHMTHALCHAALSAFLRRRAAGDTSAR